MNKLRAFVRIDKDGFTVDFLKKVAGSKDCWKTLGKIMRFESEASARLFAERKTEDVEICF